MKYKYFFLCLLFCSSILLNSQTYPLDWTNFSVVEWGGITSFGVNKTHIYVGTANKGIYKASLVNQQWNEIFNDPKLKTINFMKVTDSRVYLHHSNYGANDQQFCFFTTNTGLTWQKKSISANATTFSPSNLTIYNDYLYISSAFGFGTTDSDIGTISIKTIKEIVSQKSYFINDLVIYGDSIYSISYGNGFFGTTLSGDVWKILNKDQPSKLYSKIYNDSNYIYLGTEDRGIYRYNTKTGELKSYNYNLFPTKITGIVSNYGRLYISTTTNGVLYFDNKQNKWIEVNTGLQTSNIKQMELYDNLLYILTEDYKIYKSVIPEPIPIVTKQNLNKLQFCAKESSKVFFNVSDYIFQKDNIFSVFLSDSAGNFTNQKLLATKQSRYSDSIQFIFPDSVLFSKYYRIKLTSSNPAMESYNPKEYITLSPLPSPELTGPKKVCSSREYWYYGIRNNVNTVKWEVTGGDIITKTNDSILINWKDQANGNIRFSEFSPLLCSNFKTLDVEIIKTPAKPKITKIKDSLFVDYDSGIQWFFNSQEITGAIEKKLVIAGKGYYKVQIDTYNGCPSDISDSIYAEKTIPNSIDDLDFNFTVSPNPIVDKINIQFNEGIEDIYSVQLISLEGILISEISNETNSINNSTINLNISDFKLTNGTYFLKIFNNKSTKFVKILIIK